MHEYTIAWEEDCGKWITNTYDMTDVPALRGVLQHHLCELLYRGPKDVPEWVTLALHVDQYDACKLEIVQTMCLLWVELYEAH